MTSAIDTNILLDILIGNPGFAESSEAALLAATREGPLIVSEVVVAELVPSFESPEKLKDFLDRGGISLHPSSPAALWTAGITWASYVTRREPNFECGACGSRQAVACWNCGRRLQHRQRVISDFIIGAHALTHAQQLLTRDRGYFRTYFPGLTLA